MKGVRMAYCLKRDSVFEHEPKVATERNPDVETYSRRYGELHAQAIRRRIGHSRRVGILLSGGYDSGSNLLRCAAFTTARLTPIPWALKEMPGRSCPWPV